MFIKKLLYDGATKDFPGSSDGKESACNADSLGSITGSGRSPGEEIATHSSILAWKIPQTEGPGELQSMGSQTLGHDRRTNTSHKMDTLLDIGYKITSQSLASEVYINKFH